MQHLLNGLQILYAREAVVSALAPHGGNPRKSILFVPPTTQESTSSSSENINAGAQMGEQVNQPNAMETKSSVTIGVPLASPETSSDLLHDGNGQAIELCDLSEESASGEFIRGGGEAPACPADVAGVSLETTPDSDASSLFGDRCFGSKLSSLPHGLSALSALGAGVMVSPTSTNKPNNPEPYSTREPTKNIVQAPKDSSHLDDFTRLLIEDDARLLVDLLKLAVAGRLPSEKSRESLSQVLDSLGAASHLISSMLLELCVTELEDVATDTERIKSVPQPVIQESSHPYTHDAMQTGNVRIPGAESLRIEFDKSCSTERRHDPLTIMDGSGRIVSIRSGREWQDWCAELRVAGDELKWKFNSDGSVNGWGWRFTVYPVMPSSIKLSQGGFLSHDSQQSDRSVLSRPSIDLVTWLLDTSLKTSIYSSSNHTISTDRQTGSRLAAALAACAQLSALPASQRMWSLQSLRRLMTSGYGATLNIQQMMLMSQSSTSSSPDMSCVSVSQQLLPLGMAPPPPPPPPPPITSSQLVHGHNIYPSLPSPQLCRPFYSDTALSVLVKGLPEMLLRQFEYEDPIVRGGKHLLHSAFFKELVGLACDLNLDLLQCCSETYKWAWFRRYCMAARVARALIERYALPQPFCAEVRKKIVEMSAEDERFSLDHEDHNRLFKIEHDRQLLMWLHRKPEDWTLSWGGAGVIYGWGHNHRGQLGGVDGAKVKIPTPCESLSALRPVQLVGGEQTLFAITADGKVYATGYGAGGRLGIGGTDSVCQATLLESIQHVCIKTVAVNSGGKHCLALSADGEVYSWGEGDDGKLGHGNKTSCDRPRVIEALRGKDIISISCGGAHSAATTTTGELYTWGKGRYGRLGHGDSEDQLKPKLVEALLGYRVIDVACGSGDAQTLCITDDDNVWSWGDGDYGKLGRGGSDGCKIPMKIDSLAGLGVIKVECGSQFSVALTRSGSVFTWGKGDYHRLGHGTDDHVRRPRKVAALQGKRIVSIATGSLHCVACTVETGSTSEKGATWTAGDVYTWGDNDEGQLGDGSTNAIQRPRLVAALQGKKINRVACGSAHTLAWSTNKPVATSKLPSLVPLEYDLLQDMSPTLLRNRLVLLHHFSEVFCPSIAMFPLGLLGINDGKSTGQRSIPLASSTKNAAYNNMGSVPSAPGATNITVPLRNLRESLRNKYTGGMTAMGGGASLEDIDKLRSLLVSTAKESAFRKVVQATMIRDRQHGPVIELNRINSSVKRNANSSNTVTFNNRPPMATATAIQDIGNTSQVGVDNSRNQTKLDGKKASVNASSVKTVFEQMVAKMPTIGQESLLLPHRVWKVKFIGESVDDCGGGYSESIAEMCDELGNTSTLPLFMATPNGRDESGTSRDCLLLNSSLASQQHMNQFRFLGILMGIAVRTGSPLSLNLAEPMWKLLAGSQLTLNDITEVDKDYMPGLLCIRDMEPDSKAFSAMDMSFSTPSAAGQEVQLSARYTRVTAENRNEYVRLAMQYRLHEFDAAITAVREGMSKVIPVPLLSLFTGYELEMMVCGSPDIPLHLLKSVATYKGVDANAPLVHWFWSVMEEFSTSERSLFLRFVWGRTRLPRSIADFRGRDFVLQIMDKYNPPDKFLPESYTCFFLLKMPRYTCKNVLREKLKYAIHFCKSIDTDDYARVALPINDIVEDSGGRQGSLGQTNLCGIAMSTCSNDDSSDVESVIESEDRAMQERNTAQLDAISIGSAELV